MMLKSIILSLIIISKIANVLGGITLAPPRESSLKLISFIFGDNTFPNYSTKLTVISLKFAKVHPFAFTDLMEKIHKYSKLSITLMEYVPFSQTEGENFLILQYGNETDNIFKAIDSIDYDVQFGFRRVIIWYDQDVSNAVQHAISLKATKANINELLFIHPPNQTRYAEMKKKISEAIRIVVKNVILSKKKPEANNEVTFETDINRIIHDLSRVRRQLNVFRDQLLKLPLQIQIFPRPISVEELKENDKIVDYIGVDISLLKQVVEKLDNVSYVLHKGKPYEYGSFYKNGSYTASYINILSRKIDLSINRFVTDESEPGIVAIPYESEMYCFIVRREKNQIRRWRVLSVFDISLWTYLATIYIAVLTLIWIMKLPNWRNIMFLQSIVSSASHININRCSHRVLWFSWLIFCLLINNIFTSLYITQLLPQMKEQPIKTIEELIENNYTLISEVGNFRLRHPLLKSRHLPHYYGNVYDINDSSALLTSALTARKIKKMYSTEFYRVRECLPECFVGPLMAATHPLFDKINHIISQIQVADLTTIWYKTFLTKFVPVAEKSNREVQDRQFAEPLKTEELQNIIIYYFVGLTAATTSFLCEILVFNIIKRYAKKPKPKIIRVFPYTN